jgi:hypothetical protein
LGMIQSH